MNNQIPKSSQRNLIKENSKTLTTTAGRNVKRPGRLPWRPGTEGRVAVFVANVYGMGLGMTGNSEKKVFADVGGQPRG